MVQDKAISDGKTHYSQNFKDQDIEALVTDTQMNVLERFCYILMSKLLFYVYLLTHTRTHTGGKTI